MTGDPSFVVDCSVAMAWCFADERTPATDAILDRLTEVSAMVPSLWLLEISNCLLMAERRNRISQAQSINLLDTLLALPIIVVETRMDLIPVLIPMARSNSLSAYDCAYIMLALKENLSIATLDKDVIKAANNLGIGLL